MRAQYMIVAAALVAVPAAVEAQTPRRQAPIEIRGQVPTPQVVTVRPREVPAYSRQVLVPNFYDHDFWPSILPGYQIVQPRTISGRMPGDTAGAAGVVAPAPPVSPAVQGDTLRTRPLAPPVQGDTTRTQPPPPTGAAAPAGGTGSAAGDAARRPGTASALPRR